MKTCSLFVALVWSPTLVVLGPLLGAAESEPLLKLRPVPFTQVQITDRFWAPRQATNRLASIPVNLENLEKAGNLKNLRLAAEKATQGFTGPVFMDSDVYKALEAASYSLATHPDPQLAARLDELIAVLAAAQQPDGYLNSYFVVKEPDKRWANLRDWHELYCAGHLFEAAVAHAQATGKRNFLEVAIKLADHIDSVFGSAPGKRMGYPGHPEIELALVKLAHATGQRRYLELARFFVENRGRRFFAEEHHTPLDRYDGTYWQDDVPIYEHRNIKGHAVRAAYLMSGATDVAAETGDPRLLRMLQRVWRNTTERNLYVTGGIGPSGHNEGFTVDYDLPNRTAYQETCASVALAQWNHRLALLYGDARYADVFERSLYNGVLAGVSLDGTRFFYVNPLASSGQHHRSEWFGCACCPPNVARTIASLGEYACATSADALYFNLYIQGAVTADVAGQKVRVDITTAYPWEGRIQLGLQPTRPGRFALRLRVPGWCTAPHPGLKLNGAAVAHPTRERGYLVLEREWRAGDTVELDLPMPVERIAAHPRVRENHGLVALQRGPLVYCLEACDNPTPFSDLYLLADADVTVAEAPDRLGGIRVLKAVGATVPELSWRGRLYQPAPRPTPVPLEAIPYYAWDNRQAGEMQVWLPVAPPTPVVGGLETEARVSLSFVSGNCHPQGIHDGLEPRSSNQHPGTLCHWWPHKASTEWAQYTWKQPVRVDGTKVYWFDDTGSGACRLPAGWHLEYQAGDTWKPVVLIQTDAYPNALNQWCEVRFQPVTTSALRLVVQLQKDWAAGVHEWKVVEAEDE